ncbi:sulfotransferase family 2 domain-containing protein [Novosphingobium sp.]|uniref:sulfotransferase family 2 domain-containing protein n=1 Tax=Novosphingobium sp. TaxID=1874826 RepID=UPI0025FAA9B1|nr:sulfotransferase family 2 domain-containing protein [Novosphingobium sp.]
MHLAQRLVTLASHFHTGELTLQRVRARRRGDSFRDAGTTYIHVPRTGGTSIASAIFGRFIGHFSLADLLAVSGPRVLALPRFTIVRNPWDRLISAWTFASQGRGDAGDISIKVNPRVRKEIQRFHSFEAFVEEWLFVQDTATRDGIFRPQHGYIVDGAGRMRFDHVGRMESMAMTQDWLSDTLKRHVVFGHVNRSARRDYRGYYTPRLRDLVAAAYERDIALLNYDF